MVPQIVIFHFAFQDSLFHVCYLTKFVYTGVSVSDSFNHRLPFFRLRSRPLTISAENVCRRHSDPHKRLCPSLSGAAIDQQYFHCCAFLVSLFIQIQRSYPICRICIRSTGTESVTFLPVTGTCHLFQKVAAVTQSGRCGGAERNHGLACKVIAFDKIVYRPCCNFFSLELSCLVLRSSTIFMNHSTMAGS